MEKDLVKRAHDAFNQGDYLVAKELYQKAAKRYGKILFNVNIALCEKHLQSGDGIEAPPISEFFENIDIKNLQEKVCDMELKLREKDANINERFEELAILTRMLEEKDNAISF